MADALSPPLAPVPLTMTAEEVASALQLKPGGFRVRRRMLEDAGFPRPLPGLRGRWSAEAVRAWIALAGTEDRP